MRCDVCEGRGWLVPSDWANKCWACTGTGALTFGRMASLLYEPVGTVKSVYRLRARPKTAKRVFDGVMKLLEPKKQKEMFK
jgi:hypothetical protein